MANLILFIYTLASSMGLIFMKLGSQSGAPVSFADHKLSLNLTAFFLAGVLLYGISFALYTYLISQNNLGYIVPISTAIVYIFIFSASFIIFKESFTLIKITAIVLILSGVILLNTTK